MTSNKITLIGAASFLKVHPRTIVRALSGEHNTYWYDTINENLFSVADIAKAYNMSLNEFKRVIEGRDELIVEAEAAKMLQINPRTFRQWVHDGYFKKIKNGHITRYFKNQIVSYKIAREG